MVKTVLHELVRLQGAAIKGHLSMVASYAQPRPIILGYIDVDLQVRLAITLPIKKLYSKQFCWVTF